MDNRTIARRLLDHANELAAQRDNLYRVRAYRRAAESVLTLDRAVEDLVNEQGRTGLEQLPGIGPHLSFTIVGLVQTGEFHTLSCS